MYLSSDQTVDRQTYLNAKHYIEEDKIPFFDFFRNCAFGFVQAKEKGGYYVQVTLNGNKIESAFCRCREERKQLLCSHALAIVLKARNWPLKVENLSESFDSFIPKDLFIQIGHSIFRSGWDKSKNPRVKVSKRLADSRFLAYLGFRDDGGTLADRDKQALVMAKKTAREDGENHMLLKGFPSSRVMFEESWVYGLMKLFFQLDRQDLLDVKVTLHQGEGDDHQVTISFASGNKELLVWTIPVDTYLKGIKSHLDYWGPKTRFPIQHTGMPLTYRIQYIGEGDLEIEAMVHIGDKAFASLSSLAVPRAKNLYFHQNLGYFRIQTGLSSFELTYSGHGPSRIDKDKVVRFLKEHRETLESLDRQLFDPALLGEVIFEQFDKLHLELFEITGELRMRSTLTVFLSKAAFPQHQLAKLLEKKGRYVKMGGKFFDKAGADGTWLRSHWPMEAECSIIGSQEILKLEGFFGDRLNVVRHPETEGLYDRIISGKTEESGDLSHTKLQLRPYQTIGFEWLQYLNSFGLGGLLCDQMGLGKTHQGMSLIAAVLNRKPEGRALVVAPTSVLFHWQEKLNQFCPGLSTVIHHGANRSVEEALAKAQVIITSYGTMRNDAIHFAEHPLSLLFFDEIQFAKNKSTKTHRELARLKASCRIGLTGTPIENKVDELKALLDLVLPGYMGSDQLFQRVFSEPITQWNSTKARERLRKVVNPFILRRSKQEVLIDLPEKTEDTLSFEMTDYERELYKEVWLAGRNDLFKGPSDQLNMLHVFQLINLLKKVCNHPSLFHGSEDYNAYPSSKWRTFTELLNEALEGGEKVVIFSQYLGMIDMFQRYLEHNGVAYACITGAVKDRAEQQQRFQNDPNCRVFIGTLQSSGFGIDLTSGTVMFHYDRWWNPAREEQATDRIHRIGQKKPVTVYKFLVRGSIEERIDEIIRDKRNLLENVVGFDQASLSKILSREELIGLLDEIS